jgi:DNA mismatch endonuclease, patch repair protein
MIVRSLVHSLGYRYVLHKKGLPGKPDLVFVSRHKIINVNGCFFHMHTCKYGRVVPITNAEFWAAKRLSNVRRDRRNARLLKEQGWETLTLWECEVKNAESLERRITTFLNKDESAAS